LSVKENLLMGAYLRRDRKEIGADLEWVGEFFPRLRERIAQQAGTLSGGEQQMLAIGRALMGRPGCLMLDEPSLGIAPLLVETIFERLVALNRERGMTMLLVEQNASLALQVSRYAYVLETGSIHLEGPSAELRDRPEVRAAYLGH
jgi:branched-chain amino acid transport system ATP-binding protein